MHIPDSILKQFPISSAAADPFEIDTSGLTVTVSLEERRGKTVTLVGGLPANDGFLKSLAKELKKVAGAGGTYRCEDEDARVEIQGDHREAVRKALQRWSIKV